MNKKIMMLALAAVTAAVVALPAAASATPWHISSTGAFGVKGPAGSLTTTSGSTISCKEVTGTGNYTTTTTGTLSLVFHGCTRGEARCASTPTHTEASETITSTALEFHNVMLGTGQTGVLVTPPSGSTFAHFTCAGIPVTVEGNGIIGTVTSPACGDSSNTATLSFTSKEPGHPTHTTWTGVNYDLTSNIFGIKSTASMDATATITFAGGAVKTKTCT